MFEELIKAPKVKPDGTIARDSGEFNPIFMMADSGARGSKAQMKQLAGMRGLMAKPSGEIIETPITSNFREGLSVLEYFVSTHGARKGLADTALKTADSGYLTRRLVDVAQDIVVTEYDCATSRGITVSAIVEAGQVIETLTERIVGRIAAEDIIDPFTKKVIVKRNEMIDEKKAQIIENLNIEKVKIRSVLTCETTYGVCALCYGRDLSTGKLVEIGEAVGVIAAQSIGEPGTQLTMRTFHIGGAARAEEEEAKAETKTSGKVIFHNLKISNDSYGNDIVLSRLNARILISQPIIFAPENGKIIIEYGEHDVDINKTGRIIKFIGETLKEEYNIPPIDFVDLSSLEEVEFEGKIFLTFENLGEYSVKKGDILAYRVRENIPIPDRIPYGAKLLIKNNSYIQPVITTLRGGVVSIKEIIGDKLIEVKNEKDIMTKTGKVLKNNVYVCIHDPENDEEIERYYVVEGSYIYVKNKSLVEKDTPLAGPKIKSKIHQFSPSILIAEWERFSIPILAGKDGILKFEDVIEDVTISLERDEVSGYVRRVIGLYKDEVKCPVKGCTYREARRREGANQYCQFHIDKVMIPLYPSFFVISDENEDEESIEKIPLPIGAHIVAEEGQNVKAGDKIGFLLKETTKTKDITGGLPRVVELFEARKPKEPAIISEIPGVVHLERVVAGKRKVRIISDEGIEKEYLIPKGTHLQVHDGDRVKAGDQLIDGMINPQDILKVLGIDELQEYLLKEIQQVYRLQGVDINDKHIEIIIKQMLRMVKIKDVGDSNFILDQLVDKHVVFKENEKLMREGKRPAIAEPILLGITKAALNTESFFSAASFQETTRVLTEAAISGKIDYLRGLKENVIIGRLIPAGTGAKKYRDLKVKVVPPQLEMLEQEKKDFG